MALRSDGGREPLLCPPTGGFTLIELMVVIVILGVVSSLIIPEIAPTYRDALLRASARELLSAMQLAASEAATLGRPHRLVLDPARGLYRIEAEEDLEGASGGRWSGSSPGGRGEGGGGSPDEPLGLADGEGTIDPRIGIEVRSRDQATSRRRPVERKGAEAPESVEFRPDGTADAATVVLDDKKGSAIALTVDPVTSRVLLSEMEKETTP